MKMSFLRQATIAAALLLCAVFCQAQQVQNASFNFYDFKESDTAYRYLKVDADSFEIRYIHGSGYMDPLVARIKCDSGCDLTIANMFDSAFYTKCHCHEDTDYYREDRHYFSHIQVFQIVPCRCFVPTFDKIPIGKEMDGYYVPHGCFEDVPEEWITLAKRSVSK